MTHNIKTRSIEITTIEQHSPVSTSPRLLVMVMVMVMVLIIDKGGETTGV